ncbi:hybrid sensor histidine kinase/response regulator [Halorarius litoreus]|uniref:hybrid sensor histidine kinase/response regulator n=1 Tax=Halorarius litoreus TaxID=2962676 RepID=UPI0020CB6E46|nr:PAS domain S-box protein [Halorarius litoreus]
MTTDQHARVVCVDADRKALDRTVSVLAADSRFTVEATTDPAAVLGLVTREGADCVLSDYRFPETDGLALFRHLRANAPELPFVLYTADGDEALASEAIGAGVSDYLVKPAEGSTLTTRLLAAIATASEQVDARTQLREQRRFVDDALDALDDVFYVIDTDGRMVQWNRRFNDLWGYSDAEIAGMRPWEFVEETDREKVETTIDTILEEGEGTVEVTAVLADGSNVRLDLHGRRLTDSEGTVVGLCGIGRDVTARERTEWQLRAQNEQLEEFASVLSHDLRNPLAVAEGYLQLAREEHDSVYLENIATAHERMARLIDDVLTTARQGTTVDSTEPVSLSAAVQGAWNSVATDGATLRIETDRTVDADPRRFQRILENLLRNAVEHVGPDVTVTVGDTPHGFYVGDDGPGIPPELRERVFDAGVTTADGTGFGLNIVRSLAQAHGWAVSVRESPEGGACFEFVESPTVDDD